MIAYSRGQSIRDNHPRQRRADDFAAFVAALDADRAPSKPTAGYICGPLNGDGRRCAEGAQPRRWLPADLDYIAPGRFADVLLWFAGKFSGCAWPTHSSTAEAPRERIIIELDRDADRAECIRIGAVLARDLADEFGADVAVDPSTFRTEQACFVPPTGVTLARLDGEPLDVDAYVEAAGELPHDEAPRGPVARDGEAAAVERIRRGEALHETIGSLTARWAAKGMDRAALDAAARGLLELARPVRGSRVDDFARDELGRLIGGALKKYARPAPEPDDEAPPPWSVVEIDDLDDAELSPQEWLWDGYIPAGVVTLLGAHGGAGKSFVALLLAICCAAALALFGVATKPARVLYYSAEDSATTIRRRLQFILRAMALPAAALGDRLHVLDASEGAPVLFREVNDRGARYGMTTPTAGSLKEYVADRAIELLIVDNASDTFDASEIDRARVRQFMRELRLLAPTVLLLVHVPKVTSRRESTGESYSGSTAWHNSARSRLFLDRGKDGELTLLHEKCQFAPPREPLRLTWPHGGIPTLDVPLSGFVQAIAADNATKPLLRLIHEFSARGEFVSTATSGPACMTVALRDADGYPKRMRAGEVIEAMRRAERRGLVERVSYFNANRKQRERWQLTHAGMTAADLAPVAPVAPVPGIGAISALAHRPAPVAPVPGARGVGGSESAETGAAEPFEPDSDAGGVAF